MKQSVPPSENTESQLSANIFRSRSLREISDLMAALINNKCSLKRTSFKIHSLDISPLPTHFIQACCEPSCDG